MTIVCIGGEEMDVLQRIRELQNQRNWSEYQMSKAAGLPQSTVSSWYSKGMQPSLSSLEKICSGFGITPSQFFCEGEGPIYLTKGQVTFLEQYDSLTKGQKETVALILEGMKG